MATVYSRPFDFAGPLFPEQVEAERPDWRRVAIITSCIAVAETFAIVAVWLPL